MFRVAQMIATTVLIAFTMPFAIACCPTGPSGKPVVNADQTVIMIWDAAAKTQHFIRQASFKGEAKDFGFLVPSPSEPQIAEAGGEAFSLLKRLTEPETQTKTVAAPLGCGGLPMATRGKADVVVMQE